MASRLITLTTDFGYRDPFVGIMKGVILGINPDAHIADLNHGLPPQGLMATALSLGASVPFFPRDTIHLCVVDPGVGSERKPLAIDADGYLFVGPDNGIFTLAVNTTKVRKIIELTDNQYHLKPTSRTFQGRDIFAPVAAHLSLGTPIQELGHPVNDFIRLPWPGVNKNKDGIEGEILYLDGFGNMITYIYESELAIPSEKAIVSFGNHTIRGLSSHYSSGEKKHYLALINSWGLVEIAIYKGNAHLSSQAKVGDRVKIESVK